jgi:predicted dinucleotide-binding enzyme
VNQVSYSSPHYSTLILVYFIEKLSAWKEKHSGKNVLLGNFADAAKYGDVVVLCVKGNAAESAINLAGPENLAGKIVIDATNPINDNVPPVNGVLSYFTDHNCSLMEILQKAAPHAHFVKAFSCVGK